MNMYLHAKEEIIIYMRNYHLPFLVNSLGLVRALHPRAGAHARTQTHTDAHRHTHTSHSIPTPFVVHHENKIRTKGPQRGNHHCRRSPLPIPPPPPLPPLYHYLHQAHLHTLNRHSPLSPRGEQSDGVLVHVLVHVLSHVLSHHRQPACACVTNSHKSVP